MKTFIFLPQTITAVSYEHDPYFNLCRFHSRVIYRHTGDHLMDKCIIGQPPFVLKSLPVGFLPSQPPVFAPAVFIAVKNDLFKSCKQTLNAYSSLFSRS